MENFLTNVYEGIEGVTVYDSGIKGKNVGIFALTHGNEPIGLDVFKNLADNFGISKKLKNGKLFLVVINIQAYEGYISCGDINKYRFIDDNMNRISNQDFKKGSIEHERFKEIKPIFKELDCVLDIHNLTQGDDFLAITDNKNLELAKKIFSVDAILTDNIEKTGAVIGELLRDGKEAYGVEFGSYSTKIGLEKGMEIVLSFLGYNDIIELGSYGNENKVQKVFQFKSIITIKSNQFKYIKEYIGFKKIEEGEVFAFDGGKKVTHKLGKDIFIGIASKAPIKGDGAGFLFKKLQ